MVIFEIINFIKKIKSFNWIYSLNIIIFFLFVNVKNINCEGDYLFFLIYELKSLIFINVFLTYFY